MTAANEIEKLPEGWRRVRLGDVLDYEQPQRYIVKSEKYDDRHGTPVLTPGKAFILGFTDETTGIFEEVPVIIFDDFTTESRYVIFPFKVKSSALKVLKLKDRNSNLYFLYNIMQILNFKPGSEHKRFWISEYSKINILIPPLPEQRKIAEILETVDNAIEKTDAIIEKYKRIKQGLMQDLLTRGIDENGQIRSEETHRFKDSPLGRIPEEWKVVELGEVFKLKSGMTRPCDTSESGNYPIYGGNGILGYTNEKNFDIETIIIGRVGEYCGVVYIASGGWVTDNALYVVVKKRDYNNLFLCYLLNYVNLNQYSAETGQPLMTQSIVYKIQIPLPPLPEQHRIASILSQIDEAIEKEQKYKEKLERIKRGLMEDLLTGKVRVNHLIEEGERNEN